jgi:homoserine kinase
MPETAALVADLRAAGTPAVVSGAGPSVLAFTTSPAERRLADNHGWRVERLSVDTEGARWTAGGP